MMPVQSKFLKLDEPLPPESPSYDSVATPGGSSISSRILDPEEQVCEETQKRGSELIMGEIRAEETPLSSSDDDDFEEVEEILPEALMPEFVDPQKATKNPWRATHSRLTSEAAKSNTQKNASTNLQTKLNTNSPERLEDLEQQLRSKKSTEASMTEKVYEDCQELLRLFGIPYIVAPGEAEAQCAHLEEEALTSGTISDDSDVWLFGARRVYRHVFNRTRHVQHFNAGEINNKLGLSREKLILIAMLTGCDYTDGVENVGVVSALEILSEFSGKGDGGGVEGLKGFRDWWERARTAEVPAGTETKDRLRRLACSFQPSFPDQQVFNAYMEPNVEKSRERFSWGSPNMENLVAFAGQKMGWSPQKVNELVGRILKEKERREGGGSYQSHMGSFMVKLDKDPEEMRVGSSKRVEEALRRLRAPHKEEGKKEDEDQPRKSLKLKPSQIGRPKKKESSVEHEAKKSASQKRKPANPSTLSRRTKTSRASKARALGKMKELNMSESSSSDSD